MTESTERAGSTRSATSRQERPLTDGVPEGEDLDAAQEADDLEQDPDAVPNRAQEPEPPTPERVGPWDDEDLED